MKDLVTAALVGCLFFPWTILLTASSVIAESNPADIVNPDPTRSRNLAR